MIRRSRTGKRRQKRRKNDSESRAVCPRGFYLVRFGCADVARVMLWWRSFGAMVALIWRYGGAQRSSGGARLPFIGHFGHRSFIIGNVSYGFYSAWMVLGTEALFMEVYSSTFSGEQCFWAQEMLLRYNAPSSFDPHGE